MVITLEDSREESAEVVWDRKCVCVTYGERNAYLRTAPEGSRRMLF